MTPEKILQSDVLDILFEGKNKLYGAYELRRHYDSRMKKALAGTFILIAIIGFGRLMANRGTTFPVLIYDTTETRITQVDLPKKAEPEKPKEKFVKQNVATVNTAPPEIVPDNLLPETKMPDITQIDTSAISSVTKPGEGIDINIAISQDPPASGGGGRAIIEAIPEKPAGPVDMGEVDQLPQYPGGKEAMVRFMINNLTSELEPGIKYAVKAMFIIDEEGRVSEAQILHSDDAALNTQVLKAIKKMKKWKPGIQNGQAVAVRFVMPVTFMGAEE